jgi:acyl-CoA synthetase (AMP-forming)/AMP-acid ligase II
VQGLRGAVFTVDDGGEAGLVVVHEARTDRADELEEAMDAIRAELARVHGLAVDAVGLIPRRALPITSSGKVRRQPTRAAWLAGELGLLARWDSVPRREPQVEVA